LSRIKLGFGGVSDCEELVGILTGDDGVGFRRVIHSHVRHEAFLRGKKYITINLHISRKIC